MTARSRARQRTKTARLVIGEDRARDNLISFIPEAFRIYPKTLTVTVGEAGRGEARVFIEEDDYERSHFYFNLNVEGPSNGQADRFSMVSLDGACLTLAGLDNLIEALTVARAEAAKLGLFTPRTAPKTKLA